MTFAPDTTCIIGEPSDGLRESFGYIRARDEDTQLYFVRHHASGSPRGAVLLCGSIGAERERGLRTIVDLGRRVSAAGFDAFRFDYRGIGESAGRFEDYCLSDWREDIDACINQIRGLLPGLPLGLWGVRAGALLASRVFASGVGDAAMYCSPMDGANLLADALRRSLVADMLANPRGKRTTREELVEALESGALIDVDGYAWSRRLWRDAASHMFILPADEPRPWRIIDFSSPARTGPNRDDSMHRTVNQAGRFWESSPWLLTRDSTLAASTNTWLNEMVGRGAA